MRATKGYMINKLEKIKIVTFKIVWWTILKID